jgi:hypothetical protein
LETSQAFLAVGLILRDGQKIHMVQGEGQDLVDGGGSQTLNDLLTELAFPRPQNKSAEVFMRLHHRCALYYMLNDKGANGEDFLVFGYRHHF